MGLGNLVWIIDDGPLDMMAAELDAPAVASWPQERFFVAEATYAASQEHGSRRRAFLHAKSANGQSVIRTFDVLVGTQTGLVLYDHLRRHHSSSADLAEHQAIAWAIVERPTATVVTADKAAATLALSELGMDRVCHPMEFWKYLEDASLITTEVWGALCERLLRADRTLPGLPWRYRKHCK